MGPAHEGGLAAPVSAALGGAPPSDAGGLFFVRVNFVFVTSVITAFLALLINVVLFRELGAAGKGHYTLFTLATTIGSGASTLGVGLANVYFIGRGRYPLRALIAGSEFLVGAVTVGIAAIVAALAVTDTARHVFGDLPAWLFALSVPMALQLAHLAPVLQARHRFAALNLAGGVIPGGTIAGVALLALFDGLTVERALLVWVASCALANIIAITGVGWGVFAEAFPFRPSFGVLRDQIRFGMQGELGNLLQLVNYRFDQFVVVTYLNAAAVGFYSVAVAVAESLWLVSGATLMVLTPRLTGADDEDAAEFAPFVCRTVLLVNILLAICLAAASRVLIETAFGSGAGRSVLPLMFLLPGVVAMSGGMTLSAYIFSRGRPILNTYTTAATVVITLALDLILIPIVGIRGAAIASSVAYTASFALALFWFRRLSGRSPWTAVAVRPSDFRVYAEVARRAGHRMRHAMARGA